MTANQLTKILKTLPEGSFDVIVRGRELNGNKPVITASVPDGVPPEGWLPASEPAIQHVPGHRRVRWAGLEASRSSGPVNTTPPADAAYVCSDFHPDRELPDYCEGCSQHKDLHK